MSVDKYWKLKKVKNTTHVFIIIVTVGPVMVQIWLLVYLVTPLIFYIQSKDYQEHCHCEHRADSRAVEAEVWEGEGEE